MYGALAGLVDVRRFRRWHSWHGEIVRSVGVSCSLISSDRLWLIRASVYFGMTVYFLEIAESVDGAVYASRKESHSFRAATSEVIGDVLGAVGGRWLTDGQFASVGKSVVAGFEAG